jgi:hypothetical protein
VITQKTIVDIENQPPNKPSKPSGSTSINLGTTYTYKATTTDPNSDEIYYIFDWGDGEVSYSGPHKSGETGQASHRWNEKKTYKVTVGVFDIDAKWSDWSEPLDVSVTKSRQKVNRLLLDFFQNIFEKHPDAFPILQRMLQL